MLLLFLQFLNKCSCFNTLDCYLEATYGTYASLYSVFRSLDGLQDQIALQAPKLKKNAQETDFVKLKCKEYEKINKELEVNVHRISLD